MGHTAIEPPVGVIAHAVAALCEDRLALRQAFAPEVFNEVRLPRGVDPAFLDHRQPVGVHRLTTTSRSFSTRRRGASLMIVHPDVSHSFLPGEFLTVQ